MDVMTDQERQYLKFLSVRLEYAIAARNFRVAEEISREIAELEGRA